MGSFLENYDLLSRLLLQALINNLWQGALIVGCVTLLFRLMGRVSATTRHAIWLVSLLTIALLPFLPASTQKFTMPIPIAKASETYPIVSSDQTLGGALAKVVALAGYKNRAGTSGAGKGTKVAVTAETALPMPAETQAHTGAEVSAAGATPITDPSPLQLLSAKLFGGRVPMVLVTLWLSVCAFMLGRIVCSYFRLARLRRRLHRLPDFQRHRMSRLATIFGLKRSVRIRTSTAVAMPMTIGVARPLIIVPEGLLENLSQSEFESIIAHELAHIKRCDYLTNLWQRVIQAFLFFHPAVWLIGKQLAVERELACDDWAVKLTGEPHRYASCLTRLAELLRERRMPALAASIIFGKHVVSRRIEMILNTNRNATTSVSKPALVYAMSVAVMFVAAYSFFSPVLAVPLTQSQAQAQVARRQEPQPATPAPVAVPRIVIVNGHQTVRPAPEVATVVMPEIVAALALADVDVTPVTVVAPDEPFDEMDVAPAPMPAVYRVQPALFTQASYQQPTQPPQPQQPPQGGWGQGNGLGIGSGWGGQQPPLARTGVGGTETPTIPEAELIAVLSDIVKKDADPNVRSEALQGIYRLRSDASIDALIQIYDAMADVKVKGDILSNLLRRNKDNNKAIAKLAAVAKTEKDETLRSRALNSLVNVKGDEGAGHLISIYDSLQDAKMKQSVIRALALNKSKKAIDKLILIAKNDSDPTIRQYAVRSIISIDEGLYMQLLDKPRTGISGAREMQFHDLDQETQEKIQRKLLETHPEMTAPAAPITPKPSGVNKTTTRTTTTTSPTTPAPRAR